MFIGRERELNRLHDMYNRDKFECAVLYGRRRVGKTTLIHEFIKDKKAIYFAGLETSSKTNLENLSKSIFNITMNNISATPCFGNFQEAFDYIYEVSKTDRIILVIDEYPYLAGAYKAISSLLQIQIDLKYKNSMLFIILCGSSMSFMENQVLGYQSPLYGRRTAQFHIQPFDFYESMLYHKNYDLYDAAVVYGITGGIPQYLYQINDNKSVKDNIIYNFFDPASYLFEEPSNLLKQELREPQMYNEIITAIATGSSRLNEIATKTGLETAVCSKYLLSLLSLGIVKKERSILTENSKKTIYRLKDNMFRFWYRFVPGNISQIYSGGGERIFHGMEQQISTYMGEVFEEICRQYMWRENMSDHLPFYFRDIGRWWGTNPMKRCEQEIDLIAFDESKAVFCECKWKNEPVGSSVVDELIEKSLMFHYKEKYYYIFSKSGFHEDCMKKSSDTVKLIEFKDMVYATMFI